eukprot:478261-Amphidinium_carterae.2
MLWQPLTDRDPQTQETMQYVIGRVAKPTDPYHGAEPLLLYLAGELLVSQRWVVLRTPLSAVKQHLMNLS